VWVVNCNLQRLDGPVRGNGRIIDELERLFAGAGWNVVKLVWGSDWDGLFARDLTGALVRTLQGTVDGQMQTFAAKDGRFNRDNFFGQSPELAALAQGMTDEQIDRLKRGGHDLVKIHAAYAAAAAHKGQPTVILAHTKKGYGMGTAGQGKMTTHSQKKLHDSDLIEFRNRFNLPLTDAQATGLAFYKPAEDSPEMQYLRRHRQQLGGYLPRRETVCDALPVPAIESYAQFALQADGKEMSTTMAFVRMLGTLLKDAQLGPRIVPIVADEARTFGMANLFKQVGIYSSVGQRYAPEDIGSVLSYREALDGQILEEGISEAGAIASWTAAATSYSVHGLAMLPFYIYYSMFGFQRVGDAIWAAADQRARGFLLGATSGRTTLGGEGLQHQDGTSHLVAATIPNCKAYDPAYAGEMAVIIDAGMREMVTEQRDVFYYVTLMNENYAQPDLPAGATEGVLRGCYVFKSYQRLMDGRESPISSKSVTLMGSGAILTEVVKAAELLAAEGVEVTVLRAGGRVSPRRARYLFFASPKKSTQKKGDPAVCDPFALLRGKPAAGRLRGAPWNSLRAGALRSDNHGESDHEACARRRACHPANAPPQAQPEGGGQPKARQPNSHTGHCCARPSLRSAGACARAVWAERSDGPYGCPLAGSLQDAPRSAGFGGSGLASV
jgi:pyruvate dehydrogenase E1 component